MLTLDAYYHPQSHLSLAERAHLNFDHPDALDWGLLSSHLAALTRGEAIDEPLDESVAAVLRVLEIRRAASA